jgi:hypothetical protein
MKRILIGTAGLILLATAALALGGCGHYGQGYCGSDQSRGSYATADGHRHGAGCGHPCTP